MRTALLLAVLALLLPACSSDEEPAGDDDSSSPSDDDDSQPDDDDDLGDDDDTDPGDDDDSEGPHSYECAAVGSAGPDGFFALHGYQGKLYAGLFGYGMEGQSMVYSYPPYQLTSPGLTGISESVCAMTEFDGWLYANTESSADIFRTADGSNWERVFDGPGSSIGCGLEALDDWLYAVQYSNGAGDHGVILRSSDGTSWSTVFDSGSQSLYIREITSHAGTLHAFAVDEDTSQGYRISSTNGTDWTTTTTPSRIFRGHSHDGYLWLASTDRGSSGASGVWRFDGSQMDQVHQASKRYVTEITHFDGALFAGTSDGWKEDEGTSSLLMSRDGSTWETVCTFPELAAWSIAVSGDHLYVGTWQYTDGGQLYEVSIVEGPVGDDDDDDASGDVDCSLISSANPAWEVCVTGPDSCAGVFTDGAGCQAYCAPAGLTCTARYGGEPGCIQEPDNVIDCHASNGHQSDWCECG